MSVASGISRASPPLPSSSNFVACPFFEGHSRRENSHFGTKRIFRTRTRVRKTRVMAYITVSGVVSPRISLLSSPLPLPHSLLFFFRRQEEWEGRYADDREKWRDVIDRTLLSDPLPDEKRRFAGVSLRILFSSRPLNRTSLSVRTMERKFYS